MHTRIPHAAPIVRWAGSKRKLLPILLRRVPKTYSRYIEPFAGSACMFFALNPDEAILGDLNSALLDTYDTVRMYPLRTLRAARSLPQTAVDYYRVRAAPLPVGRIARAARFLYLNRYCFNGLYRTNAQGRFNVPFGRDTGGFPAEHKFCRSAEILRKAELIAEDFSSVIKRARRGDFVYMDPPYASRSRNGRNEYGTESFTPDDIPRLIVGLERLHKQQVQFLLSYSYTDDFINQLPVRVRPAVFVRRHIASRCRHRLTVPEVLLVNSDVFP
jgi:DNA adenine methylase